MFQEALCITSSLRARRLVQEQQHLKIKQRFIISSQIESVATALLCVMVITEFAEGDISHSFNNSAYEKKVRQVCLLSDKTVCVAKYYYQQHKL